MFQKLKDDYLLLPLAILFIMVPFYFTHPLDIIRGLGYIVQAKGILFTDYIYIAGLGPTLVNVGLILLLNLVLMKISKARMTGTYFAACVFVLGFSFFGNSILNVLPFYIGTFLYSRVCRIEYSKVLFIGIFATGVSPFFSYILFGMTNVHISVAALIATVLCTGIGFVAPALAAQAPRFHHGLQLYNMGFTCGVMALIAYPLFNLLRIPTIGSAVYYLSTDSHYILLFGLIAISAISIGVGMVEGDFNEFKKLTMESGHAVQFHDQYGVDTTMINIGAIGLLCALVTICCGIQLNGPIIGSIICVMSFSAVGKNLKNCIPLMAGVIICAFLIGRGLSNDPQNVGVLVAIFFVTGIAPIAGKYGIIAGVLAGMLHLLIVLKTGSTGGFLNLYNNGFAGGFVAFLFGTFIEDFKVKRIALNK